MNILQFLKLKVGALRATPVSASDPLPVQEVQKGTPWYYAPPSGGYTNSTAQTTVKASETDLYQYVTGAQIAASALANASEFYIVTGASTVMARFYVPAAGLAPVNVRFDPPLKTSLAGVVRLQAGTLFATGGVFVNLQGFTSPL